MELKKEILVMVIKKKIWKMLNWKKKILNNKKIIEYKKKINYIFIIKIMIR
jgi:hypothetical protein